MGRRGRGDGGQERQGRGERKCEGKGRSQTRYAVGLYVTLFGTNIVNLYHQT